MKGHRAVNPLIFAAGEGVKAISESIAHVCAHAHACGGFRHVCFHSFTREQRQRVRCNFEVHVPFTLGSPTPALIFPRVFEQDVDAAEPVARPGVLDQCTRDVGLHALQNPLTAGMVLSRKPLASAHCLNIP